MHPYDDDLMDEFLSSERRSPAQRFDESNADTLEEEAFLDDAFDDMEADEADEWDAMEADYGIVGTDDRVRVSPQARNPSTRLFPFSPIRYVQRRSAGGFSAWGTGNLVAPRVVLTAGHVLRDAGDRPLRITPGAAFDSPRPALRSTGQPPSQTVNRSAFRTRGDYRPCTATDYGIIVLPRAFTRPTRFMPLQARAAARSAIRVTVAGFPGDKQSAHPGTMWRHSEGVETVATTDGLLRHRVDTMPGSSGSPIWLLGAGDTRIQIGVHIGGQGCDTAGTRNIGVRVTDAVIAQIAQWCRLAGVRAPVMWRSRP